MHVVFKNVTRIKITRQSSENLNAAKIFSATLNFFTKWSKDHSLTNALRNPESDNKIK